MRPLLFAALAVSLFAASTAANAEPSLRQRELAARYVRAMHMADTMGETFAAMRPAMIAQFSSLPGMTEERKAKVASAVVDAILETTHEMSLKLTPEMEATIAQEFTEGELAAAVAFYESAEGQAIIGKTPKLMAAMMPKLTPMMLEMRAKMLQRVLAALCPDGTCQAASKPSKS
jgi:hypothetical protein